MSTATWEETTAILRKIKCRYEREVEEKRENERNKVTFCIYNAYSGKYLEREFRTFTEANRFLNGCKLNRHFFTIVIVKNGVIVP